MTGRRRNSDESRRDALLTELLWYARLRWVAGGVILLVGLVGFFADVPGWTDSWVVFVVVGAVVLGYTAMLESVLRSQRESEGPAAVATALGVLLDLVCLTCLMVVTGGISSPVIGLFVLHMVLVSLLMPLHMSYVAAALAVVMVAVGLRVTGALPSDSASVLFGAGWAGSLMLVAYMTNRIAGSLRRREQELGLLNQRLLQHQRAAIQQEKMTALGQMTAGVVHEIANPLSNMDSMLQLALRKPEAVTEETVGALREQVGRINNILQQMTSFAHPNQAGHERVELDDVVERALGFVRFDMRLDRLELVRELDCAGERVEMDPHAFQQVLVNLITNALDALEGVGEPRLAVRTSRGDGRCLVQVSDNGCGIGAEDVDRVFDPFFTTKPVGYGTGLGLSISYRLVERMGGEIRVESERGRGATFTMELPIADTDSSDREKP